MVRVYKQCSREQAEALADRTFRVVQQTCGSIAIPLFVNGTQVNRETALPTVYSLNFRKSPGAGRSGNRCGAHALPDGRGHRARDRCAYFGARGLLHPRFAAAGPDVVPQRGSADQAFDQLLRAARTKMPAFRAHVARQLRVRCDRLRQDGTPPERGLDANDRAALEWLRSQLLVPEDEAPDAVVRDAPVLETADGALVSANELIEVIRKEGRVPISRVPRTREEIGGYVDRGVPVLLLYRDLEDFLERQAIETIEVDGLDDGLEVAELEWGRGEMALAARAPVAPARSWRTPALSAVAASVVAVAIFASAPFWWPERSAPTLARADGPSPASPHRAPRVQAAGAQSAEGAKMGRSASPDRAPRVQATGAQSAEGAKMGRSASPDRAPRIQATGAQPAEGAKMGGPASPDVAESEPPPQQADLLPTSASRNRWSTILAAVVAILWAAAGLGMIFTARRRPRRSWLRAEAGAPLTIGESRKRRWNVVTRALLHPIDFLVARGWSSRAAGRPLAASASASIKGYREFAPEEPIRSGVRLDLDRVEIGFVDLVGRTGDANDGRFLLRRNGRVLLNRNHPTVRDLIAVAALEPVRARILLDMLLATDAELGRGTDPRQVEWDLLGRAELSLRKTTS